MGCFAPSDILVLHDTHSLLLHLFCACTHLQHYDFLWLSAYNADWAHQDHICIHKAHALLACLLHYNLSIAKTVQFLGNNYTC